MSPKEIARQVIDPLPENAELEDIIDALCIRAKFDRAEEQIQQGHGVPHEQAKQRLGKWIIRKGTE